jgi:hypothetical protein
MDTNGEVTEAPAPQITTAENEAGMLSPFAHTRGHKRN